MFEHESFFLIPPFRGTTATRDGSIQVQIEDGYQKVVGILKDSNDRAAEDTVAKIIFAWFELNQDVLPSPTVLVQVEYLLSEFWAGLLGKSQVHLTAASLPGKTNSLEIAVDNTFFKNQNESAREYFLNSVSREMKEAYTYLYVHALVDTIKKEFRQYVKSSSVAFNENVVDFQAVKYGDKTLTLELNFVDGAEYVLDFSTDGIKDFAIRFFTKINEEGIEYGLLLESIQNSQGFKFIVNSGDHNSYYLSFGSYAGFTSAIKGSKFDSEIIFHQLSQMARDLLSVVKQLKDN